LDWCPSSPARRGRVCGDQIGQQTGRNNLGTGLDRRLENAWSPHGDIPLTAERGSALHLFWGEATWLDPLSGLNLDPRSVTP
jgi:hypothetical protein